MSYVSVFDGEGYKVVEILDLPTECDMNFVLELRDALLGEDDKKIVFIKFSGKMAGFNGVNPIKCKTFHDNLRRVLIRCLFMDKYFVGLVDKAINNLELEILLALDYVKYDGDFTVSFTPGYLPLSSGTTFSIFRGGVNLLNLLFKSPKISDLISQGYIRGEHVDTLDYSLSSDEDEGMKLKKLYRELFLRLSQFIGEIESNMHYRV